MTDAPQIDDRRRHRGSRKRLLPERPAVIAGWALMAGGISALILELTIMERPMEGALLCAALTILCGYSVKHRVRTAAKWGTVFMLRYLLEAFVGISVIASGGRLYGVAATEGLPYAKVTGLAFFLIWSWLSGWLLFTALEWKLSLRTHVLVLPLATGIAALVFRHLLAGGLVVIISGVLLGCSVWRDRSALRKEQPTQ